MLELNPTGGADDTDLIKDSSEATFMADVIEASQTTPIIVDFWAPWCGPCKAMAPAFEQAAAALEPEVRLAKLNTDEAQQLAGQFGIRSIPTLILFRDGKPVAQQAGAMTAAQIESWVRQAV